MSGMIGEARKQDKIKSVEWYTPKWVFDELATRFDLDPCSPEDCETFVPANVKLTKAEDGLNHEWAGRVWLNPPYGKETPVWIEKMINHGDGIALVFSRTDAKWCQRAMQACSAMLFVHGRINFVPGVENQHKKSRCGAGTVIFSFGSECAGILARMSSRGIFVLRNSSHD